MTEYEIPLVLDGAHSRQCGPPSCVGLGSINCHFVDTPQSVEPSNGTVLVDGAPGEVTAGVLWLALGARTHQAKLDERVSESASVWVRAGERLEQRLTVPNRQDSHHTLSPIQVQSVEVTNVELRTHCKLVARRHETWKHAPYRNRGGHWIQRDGR